MATTKFSLEGKSLKFDTADDVASYAEELRNFEQLESIDLSGNTFGVDACTALADVLKTKKTLKNANLADMFTGRLKDEIPACLSVLFPALLELPDLHTINLSDNALGLAAIGPLSDFLSKHVPLKNLILANNGFGPIAGSKVAIALKELAAAKAKAESRYSLETVVCGRNRLENGSMEAWSACFVANKEIKEIRLYQNGIRQEGIEHLLLYGLADAKKLQMLDLQDNTFTVKGALALAKVLPSWSEELVELGIGDCLLSARGGVVFGQALANTSSFPNLKTLRLQYNEIDIKGVELITEALGTKMLALEKLELNGNKFSEDDPIVAKIMDIFEDRGFGELDELSDMEEDSDVEEESSEEEEEDSEKATARDLEEAEDENVPEEAEDDEVATKMGTLSI
ncbi:hypothetical protein V1512DRAFT_257899 [Lipomyces arxii]|uniref:uncharacterized protein n=1 Tax=Lipomyces arxii TaxID=56418 RepID=UPI0034CE6FFE